MKGRTGSEGKGGKEGSFRMWRMNCRSKSTRGSNSPARTMSWMNEIEHAGPSNDQATSSSMTGTAFGDFETLVASGFRNR